MTNAARWVPTPRQGDLLRLIKRWLTEHGYSPSMRELGDLLGCKSTNAVAEHLAGLENCELIRRGLMTARSIVITAAGEDWLARNPLPTPPEAA